MAENKAPFTLPVHMRYQLMGVNPQRALASLDSVIARLVETHKANGVRVAAMALTPTTQTCAEPLSPLVKLEEKVIMKAGCQQFEVAMRIKTSDRMALDAACALSGLDVCAEWEEMCWEGTPVVQCEYDPVPMLVLPLVCGAVVLVALVAMLVVLRKRVRLFCVAREQRRTERSDAVVALIDKTDLAIKPSFSNGYTTICESKVGTIRVVPVVHYSA